MSSNKLFDDSEESDKEVQFGTNADYAKSYNKFRQKELLKKYKDRGIDVSDSDTSSESESTDEDDIIDSKFDQEFFKTLSSLKSKDPAIYDKNTRFFEGLEQDESQKKKQSSKPVTLNDYERKIILENEGKFDDDTADEDEDEEKDTRVASPTYIEEQRKLKDMFKEVINEDNSDEEFGGIFKKRVKSKEEKDKEEADFTKWLAGKKDDVEDEVKKTLAPLKNYWSNSKLPQREKFLRDYILNQGYAETNFADIPTYEEIVGEDDNLSEDEVELEKQEEFEHKYNFRFEEPDSEFIKRYPRTIEQSVRKQDDKRKQKRQETKERKDREKQQKMQELEMVKAMKRKEIEEKIQKLKEVTGNDELGFKDEELEDEFDPDAHDRRMQELFNDDYYEVDEGEEKPECPDIDELKIEDWDNYDPAKDNEDEDYAAHCEDDGFNMDCDYDPNTKETMQKEIIESTRDKRKKRRRNRFMEIIKAEKPVFNPDDEATYGEYIDEYYKLDCEDMIGDLPCRFKYTETTPNDFGLTIEEILLAKNKELNQWASLKKTIQIRPDIVEKREQRLYKMKANNEFLKRKIFKSLYGEESDDETSDNQPTTPANETQSPNEKSAKRRKVTETITFPQANINAVDESRMFEKDSYVGAGSQIATDSDTAIVPAVEAGRSSVVDGKKKKKKKKNKKNKAVNGQTDQNTSVSTDRIGPEETKKKVDPVKPKTVVNNPFNNKKHLNNSTKSPVGKANKITNQKNFNKSNPNQQHQVKPKTAVNNPFSNTKKVFVERRVNDSNKTPPVGEANHDKFNKSKQSGNGNTAQITDDRLKAYGINPRKFHKKQKYGNKTS